MKIALLTANLGGFDKTTPHVKQNIEYDFFRFTDENFPPRHCSMTPRLQARIPKMFGWEMKPDYDIYVWLDSSCILALPDSLEWLIKQLGDSDILVFKHPNRNSIQEEADYIQKRLDMKCPYIIPRYENELIEEQLAVIKQDKDYKDENLYASTCVVYKNNEKVQNMMKDWFLHTTRYHSVDQLSFPFVLCQHWAQGLSINVIEESYLKTPYLKYIRNK